MRKVYSILLALLFICSVAKSQQWLDLYNEGISEYNNYNLEAAKAKCDQALTLCETDLGENHANAAAILRQLVLISYESDLLDEGIAYAKKEQGVLAALGKQDELTFGTSQFNLGLIYSALGDLDSAAYQLSRSLDLYLVHQEESEPAVAEVKGSLASVIYFQGDLDKAEPLFESAVAVLNQQDEASPEYFNIVYSYTELLMERGKYQGAARLLSILTEFFDATSVEPDYASILLKLGTAQEYSDDFNSARENYEKSIKIFEEIGDPGLEDYEIVMKSLTYLLIKEGRLEEASTLMSEIINMTSGTKDDAYYAAVANLGNIYYSGFEYELAELSYQEVIDHYSRDDANEKHEAYYQSVSGLALVHLANGQNSSAIELTKTALTSVPEQSTIKVDLLKTNANALMAQGLYNESGQVLEEAVALAGNDKELLLDLKLSLAILYTATNELEKAGGLFEEILPAYKALSEQAALQYANFLSAYANYQLVSNNFYEAENAITMALEIKEGLSGKANENYLSTYESLGRLHLTKGKYGLAKSIFNEVLHTKKSMDKVSKASLAYTYSNLGSVNKFLGEYGEADKNLRKSLELNEEEFGTDHIYCANAANELGLLYLKMGNLKAAEGQFQSAQATYAMIHTTKNVEYASVLENMAALQSLKGDHKKAKELLKQVLQIDKEILGTKHPLYSKTLHNLASTLEELEEYDEASAYYQESIGIYKELFGTKHPSYANTLYNVAVLEQETDQLEAAKKHYEEVIEIRQELLNDEHPDLAYSKFGLASVKQKLEDWQGAMEDYDFVISSYLNSIDNYFPSLSEEEKSAFYAKIKPVFEAYQDFAIEYVLHQRGDQQSMNQTMANVYDLQLATKALLLNATNKVKNRIIHSGNATLIDRFNQWISVKEDLVKALNMSNEELQRNKINIGSLQEKSNELEKELSELSESFAGEFEKEQVTWTKVRDFLGPDETAIEMLRIKKNTRNDSIYYAALMIKGNAVEAPELVIVQDGENLEAKFFKQYKNLIIYKMENPRSYGQYWKTIDQHLEGMKRVFLSSDGVYNKLNINTLYDPDNKEYVFDKYTIYLLSNTRELVEAEEEQDLMATTATVFGYPDYELSGQATVTTMATERGFSEGVSELPGTLEEIDHISETLDKNAWKYDRYQEAEANESNFKKVESPTLLHVATHGFFMSNMKLSEDENTGLQSREAKFNPLFRSGLLLAGASRTFRGEKLEGTEDGILTAYEAMNLNLDRTELVVMSACETGLGEVKNGEGVYGLQRAFMVAGADHLIMSLWKVNDATTQMLMTKFYEKWIGGEPKQQAFHDAIKELKKKFKDPYYWGAFVMLGD